MNKIRYIDLFAGIGAFHQAFKKYPSECVFASDWDKNCQETYKKNYNITPKGDITKINERDIPEHDVLCAGFPCQAFSISGKQKGFEDTRGTLFFDVVRIANFHKPKLIFLENVKNFAKHDDERTLMIVRKTLKNMGYDVFYKVLNASNFGVPQKRERIYILAFNSDLNIKNFQIPEEVSLSSCLENILEPCENVQEFVINRDDINLKQVKITADIFGNYPQKPIRVGFVNKGGQGERIYSSKGHAITLSAYGGGVGAKTGLYLIKEQIRKLSPRECARIMGFPEDFILHEKKTVSYKQFGNSIVVNVLDEIIKSIMKLNIFKI